MGQRASGLLLREAQLCRQIQPRTLLDFLRPSLTGSQICNAGFIVNFHKRGLGLGSALGKSYLHYGPKLGYKGCE